MMYGTHIDISAQKRAEQSMRDSEQQFRSLVDNIPGITYRCLLDEHWTMLYMSDQVDPLSGYPATDFVRNAVRSYASVIHPDDRDWLEQAVTEAVQQKNSWILQYRVVHQSGKVHWVEERGKAEYDEKGCVTYLDGFILDVTEEKSLKQQLLKLTSQLPGVVYQYQQWPDGRAAFPYASDNIENVYGVSPEQVKQDASDVINKIYPADLPGLATSISESATSMSLWQYQYRLCRDNGELAWLSGRATPERMPDGSTLWHGYIEDITQVKQHYLELERVNAELQLSQQRLDIASETAMMGFWQASTVRSIRNEVSVASSRLLSIW
jgi:PAS domain S-box-containing protein